MMMKLTNYLSFTKIKGYNETEPDHKWIKEEIRSQTLKTRIICLLVLVSAVSYTFLLLKSIGTEVIN